MYADDEVMIFELKPGPADPEAAARQVSFYEMLLGALFPPPPGGDLLTPEVRADLLGSGLITEAEMRVAVAGLSERVRAQLRRGPIPGADACGVCRALRCVQYREAPEDGPEDIVWRYHHQPRLRARTQDESDTGEIGAEVYARCLAIYRAAGWEGEAP